MKHTVDFYDTANVETKLSQEIASLRQQIEEKSRETTAWKTRAFFFENQIEAKENAIKWLQERNVKLEELLLQYHKEMKER